MSNKDTDLFYYDLGKATGYERAVSDMIVLFGKAMSLSPRTADSTQELLGLIEPSMRANVKDGRLLDRA